MDDVKKIALIFAKALSRGSGTGGTDDHRDLTHRSADNQHPMSAITGLVNALASKYAKPAEGIPKADLSTAVQELLDKADAAIPKTLGELAGGHTIQNGDYIPMAEAPDGDAEKVNAGDLKDFINSDMQSKITASGLLKGDGNGGVSAAVAGTDYQTPKPYVSLKRLARYLYDVSYVTLPDYVELNNAPALCSSVVSGGKLYRQLDWKYDHTATFHVLCPSFEGTAFLSGLTDTELSDALIGQLPYHVVDGVNEYGIMVAAHVLYNDWDAHGSGEIPLTMLPYTVLSRVKSMDTLADDLAGVLDNLHTTAAMDAAEYLIQVLVSDGVTTYVLRPDGTSSGEYEAVDISENAKLTNFLWVPDAIVDRADLQDRPTGVERWNNMTTDLAELRFTKAYETPDRLSEFIGIDGTDKDSTDAELEAIYDTAHAAYLIRERDGALWQTMHSAVYAPSGLEHLWVQEDWEKDYVYRTASEQDAIDAGKVDTTSVVVSVSAASTNEQIPGAKLFYDTVGDVEAALQQIRGVTT